LSDICAIGADGIRHGWVAAVGDERRRTQLLRVASVAELVEWRNEHAPSATLGLDVPMGLLERGGARPCDVQARRLLGRRASSVFNPPARYLLAAMDEPGHEARRRRVQELVAARGDLGISRQTLGIMGKVREADEHLAAHPGDQDWLVEVHPELSFLELNDGEPLPGPKHSAAGRARRLELVQREFTDAAVPRAGAVDVLDAYAALWSALRRHDGAPGLKVLGDRATPAGRLAMRIVV
jgi:predicted RNase H-like nuclease